LTKSSSRIKAVAIKAPVGKTHADIRKKDGKHGFITTDDKFVNRKQGAKIATKAKQTKTKTKNLHSTDLKKGK
jgi:hypothetical protein